MCSLTVLEQTIQDPVHFTGRSAANLRTPLRHPTFKDALGGNQGGGDVSFHCVEWEGVCTLRSAESMKVKKAWHSASTFCVKRSCRFTIEA
jgi:hypothetical protein